MDYYSQIITVAIFALYSFIFSLFILPAIKNLKGIQHKLRGLVKPTLFLSESKQAENQQRTEQVKELRNILGEYKLEYSEINTFRLYIIIGTIITLLAILILFIIQEDLPSASFITTAIYVIVIGVLIVSALNQYIPPMNKITNWSYMVKHFLFSPSGIAKCADLFIDYNLRNEEADNTIRICSEIEVRGYKYRIFAYNKTTWECVYSIIGKIDESSELLEAFPDMDDLNYWYITVGEFDLYKFKWEELEINFFIFDPVTWIGTCSPYRWSQATKFEEDILYSSTLSVRGAMINNPYHKIKYEGNGLKFKKIYWDDKISSIKIYEDRDKKIEKIFNDYKGDF